jgi:hypothetical protein
MKAQTGFPRIGDEQGKGSGLPGITQNNQPESHGMSIQALAFFDQFLL